MIHIKNINFSYGAQEIFEEINVSLYRKDKIGLIGQNGTGKTTLLKLISGELKPDHGEIEYEGNISIGYIPQELYFSEEMTPFSLCRNAFVHINDLLKKFYEINHLIAEQKANEFHYRQYDSILHELNLEDGFNLDYKIERILYNLGFSLEQMHFPLVKNSGGFKVRAYLGYLLLLNPDILLLDEPTNYLDIDSIVFLTDFLKKYDKAVIIVSHDRYFLDSVVDKIFYLVQATLFEFKNCTYSVFLNRRDEMEEYTKLHNENLEKKIKQLEAFIERFRSKNTIATRVQSAIRKVEKLKRNFITLPKEKHLFFSLSSTENRFSNILSLDRVDFGYEQGIPIVEDITFSVVRDEKILLIGKNGIGKTTLLKLAGGILNPDEGEVIIHNNAKIGYFAQNLIEQLNFGLTVLEEFETEPEAHPLNDAQKRGILGNFGFGQENTGKKVSVLSGGEKIRLVLAKIYLKKPDILILDEPTTHLDIHSKELLAQAVKNFNGAALIVSHDIEFIKSIGTIFWTIENNRIKKMDRFEQYLEFLKADSQNKTDNERPEDFMPSGGKGKSGSGTEFAGGGSMLSKSELKKVEKRKNELDHLINSTEKKIKEYENFFLKGVPDQTGEKTKEYKKLKMELDKYEEEYLHLMECEEK